MMKNNTKSDSITSDRTNADSSTNDNVTTSSQNGTKPNVVRSALVTPDNWRGMEEWYLPVIECPKCKHKLPATHTNFCSSCGIKLKISTTVQRYSDSAW